MPANLSLLQRNRRDSNSTTSGLAPVFRLRAAQQWVCNLHQANTVTRNLNIKAKLSFDVANWQLMLGVLLAYRNHAVILPSHTITLRIYTDHGNPQVLGCIHNMIADSYETRQRNNNDELLFTRASPSEMDCNSRFWTWCSRIEQIPTREYMACTLILFGIMAGVRAGDGCLRNIGDTKHLPLRRANHWWLQV